MISDNFIQIVLLGTYIQNFGEVRLILYNINLCEKYDQYKKKFFNKRILSFYFVFGYQILLGEKWKIYDVFPPIIMTPTYVRVYF